MTWEGSKAPVAPNLLVRLVRLAVREVPGVARLGGMAGRRDGGVTLRSDGEGLSADCRVIATAEANLLELGLAIQATVALALDEFAGTSVREVNVSIQDVEVRGV